MRILSWNYQGLGNPWTVRSLRKIVKNQAPTVCFLMETRLDKDGFKIHCKNLLFKNQFIVKKLDSGGGLALLWKEEVVLDVINFTANHVLAKVIEEDGFVWYLTYFYGWPESTQKFKSSALLTHLLSFVDGPWMCIGDFNAILHSSEKLSKRPPPYKQMEEFREAMEHCQLHDLGFHGYPYTWNNKRLGIANTRQRLDRAVAMKSWRAKFPASSLTHLFSHASDHAPIILHIKKAKKICPRFSRSFKFEEAWLLWEDCEQVIHNAWNKEARVDSGLARIKERIAMCGVDLHAWGSTRTHPDVEKIKRLQAKVEALGKGELTEDSKIVLWQLAKSWMISC